MSETLRWVLKNTFKNALKLKDVKKKQKPEDVEKLALITERRT